MHANCCSRTNNCQTEDEGILLKAELGWRRSSAQTVESTAHTCGVSSSTRAYLSCPGRAGWCEEAHLIAADAQWKTLKACRWTQFVHTLHTRELWLLGFPERCCAAAAVGFHAVGCLLLFLDFWSMFFPCSSELNPQETLLHFAARRGLCQVTHFLLQHPGAREALRLTNREGHTPSAIAALRGHECLQQLLHR